MQRARAWHLLTALLALTALVLQLVLVVQGHRVLDETSQPGLGTRLVRFIAYFTIQSNILVAITAVQLARDPSRDGEGWRALRIAAFAGITVTGVVHFFLLRPLLDLDGADYAADKLLHMVVPAVAFVGWVVFGPRPRVDGRAVAHAIAWPITWLVVILVAGGLSGWYPYPFLDHREPEGVTGVVVTSVGITLFFLVIFWLASLWDRRGEGTP